MKPRMQLSPGDYVSSAFRAEMNAWMADFFGYEDEPTELQPVHSDVDLSSVKHPKMQGKAPRRKRTQVQPDMETFGALLEGIEDSFYTMRVPAITGSWLAKKDVNAIKKLGVYIPNWTKADKDFYDERAIRKEAQLPSMASAFFVPKKEDTKDKIHQRFMFCLRAAKLPVNVEATRGTPYQFGACYECSEDDNGKPMPSRLIWVWCWIVVKPDGTLRIPHELRPVWNQIRHSRTLPGSKGMAGARQSTVYNRTWCMPSFAIAEQGRDQEQYETFLKCSFRQLVEWWSGRKNQWSVGIRKDGHRVTFSIAPEHTSAYFADREMVVNVEGKPRKIVHYVRPHVRSNGQEVKEHIRGLRHFNWKGYECSVIAPGLKGRVLTEFPLPPVEVDKQYDEKQFIQRQQAAERLATAEDMQ